MNARKRKVAVIGALNVDLGGLPEAAFVPGDSIPGRVVASLGGVGWNIARDCACLGAEAAFFSLLGTDEHEAAIRADAADFAVDIAGCRWVPAPNNRYLYVSGRGGELAAAVNDMRLAGGIDPAFIEACLPAINACDGAAADANLPPETLRALAEGLTVPLTADCVSAVKCPRLRELLPHIHTLKANRMEAEVLTGRIGPEDCARALLDAGTTWAVISLGAEGVLCGEPGRVFRLSAAGAVPADATGAGDSLTTALAVGLARGLDLEAAAALGMAAAGVTVAETGAVTKKLSALGAE